MDAFEQLTANLFRRLGYWTQLNYKVEISRSEKRDLGMPSMPRPDIDLLAYKPVNNTLLWIECKSYLDSQGVSIDAFTDEEHRYANRYRLFTNALFRQIVTENLIKQTVDSGLCLPDPYVQYGLVAGKIKPSSREALHDYFAQNDWLLYDDGWIRAQLSSLADLGYEDDIAIMVAKLFVRTDA